MTEYNYRIGVDLGGTKIEGALLDEKNRVIERKRIPTLQEQGYEAIVARIARLASELRSIANHEVTIGVGTPGTISPATEVMRNSNTQCLMGKPLKDDLEKALGQPVKIANDANCFTMAEATLGAAKNFQTVFGIIMGTGVGGGIVINGSVYHGRNFIAGEWGHSTLHPDGPTCYCGKRGCVEMYLSGTGLERQWQELTGEHKTLKQIVSTPEEKPGTVKEVWKHTFINNFGIAISNLINVLDPDAIILGGGVSNVPFLYDEGIAAVHRNVFSDTIETAILSNKLGDSAGVIGAAFL